MLEKLFIIPLLTFSRENDEEIGMGTVDDRVSNKKFKGTQIYKIKLPYVLIGNIQYWGVIWVVKGGERHCPLPLKGNPPKTVLNCTYGKTAEENQL